VGADLDDSGRLDRAELQSVLRQLKLGLSQAQLEQLTAECDTDGDGLFDYREFLPLMQQMIADALRAAQQPWNASAWHLQAGEPTVRAPARAC
jgi:calmodulin